MDDTELRIFLRVIDCGTLKAAAEELHSTPPHFEPKNSQFRVDAGHGAFSPRPPMSSANTGRTTIYPPGDGRYRCHGGSPAGH